MLTPADGQKILEEKFAPWVRDLGLTVEAIGPDGAVLRMARGDHLAREGGTVCGQALMSLADTTMVFVVAGAQGRYRPMTTVSQTINLLKPVSNAAVIARGVPVRIGRTMAFGDIKLYAEGKDEPVAQIATTFALLPE